ncbi:MAG: transcriptional regulator [Pseudomonadales bacterium]|jgi:DNA-binding MarR family transcriptional regulator|nr:transcriptional regulator [Pseudomonadales bacterium]MDP7360864.1 transcriptional regulator [Pseudomonadales bacterium]MDP7594070.1 transcriptional regulator [Pseudomonadales bacterium]HJN49549.1 transcriptional regulator [Pseudomonadales bacterium]|tara:strand:- start:49 stop:375 length:327 start_codon:yes stop_codon:yes gene_type:complete
MTSDDLEKAHPLSNIDKLIHEPARLMVMIHLYMIDSADFLFLMRQSGLTEGNLSSHLGKLEKAEYVAVEKSFVGKRPHTLLRLTETGRTAFQQYHQLMKQVFDELPEA